jgi:serine/threonine protein kinase/tetratricopeptide (TPR) repeat protein
MPHREFAMTPDRWRQINELFHAALTLDAPSRESYLAEVCRGDAGLREEVESLVAGHESAKASMQTDVVREAVQQLVEEDETAVIGQDFGPYRVVGEIGRGGMGRVFLAERADQEFHKRVAVKLIKRGMDTDSVIRHFRNEREILASLDHPNIARLLDGGTSRDGLPYFVMEYIEGQPIDCFCQERRHSITERLQLFQKVCAAVAYAHQHLVIHRDIKPSNILVTAEGDPKLLDFGIARLLRAGTDPETSVTMTGLQLLTPEYASPEQVLGLPASTLTDVYSLGVVLYRLLTGGSPYEFRSRSPQDVAETICHVEPKRPSTAAVELHSTDRAQPGESAGNIHEGSIERLQKRLQGDLDNIVLMAMRKEPHRRYQSVQQFSEDVRRHLESLPVLARDDSVRYRLAKFARRHRAAVAAGSVAALMLTAGVITTALEAHHARVQEQLAKEQQAKAERRFNDVRRLAHTVLFDYHDAIKNLPGATPVRQRLVRDALQYLDSLAREVTGDPSLSRELASAYERVADVQGGTFEANLGNTAGAIESGKKALQIRASLLANDPQNIAMRRELAWSYFKVGRLLWETGDMSGAADYLRQAVRLREYLTKAEPANMAFRSELAAAYDAAGMLLLEQGDAAGALEYHRRSLEIYTSAPESEQAREGAQRAISVEYEHIGSALLELKDLPGALENNSRALSIRATLSKDFPLNADHQRTLQVSYYNEGEILARMGRTRDALGSYRKDVAIGEKLLRSDPSNEQSRGDLAYGLVRVGDMLFKLGHYPEALANYRRSQDFRSADVKADPANLWKRSSLIEAKAKICKTLAAAHRPAEAQDPCSGALSLMQATTLDPGNAAIRSFFADTYSDLAEAEATLAASQSLPADERMNRWRSARNFYARSLEIWQDLQKRNILGPTDRGKQEAVSRQIARCEAALQ